MDLEPIEPIIIAAWSGKRALYVQPKEPPSQNLPPSQLRNKCQNTLSYHHTQTESTRYPQTIQTNVVDLASQGKRNRTVVLSREPIHIIDMLA